MTTNLKWGGGKGLSGSTTKKTINFFCGFPIACIISCVAVAENKNVD